MYLCVCVCARHRQHYKHQEFLHTFFQLPPRLDHFSVLLKGTALANITSTCDPAGDVVLLLIVVAVITVPLPLQGGQRSGALQQVNDHVISHLSVWPHTSVIYLETELFFKQQQANSVWESHTRVCCPHVTKLRAQEWSDAIKVQKHICLCWNLKYKLEM